MNNKVVITGIGPVSGIGIGCRDFFSSVDEMKVNVAPIPECFDTYGSLTSRFYAPAPEVDLVATGLSRSLMKMIDRGSQLAIRSAMLALEDAGFELQVSRQKIVVPEAQAAAVLIGTGMSNLEAAFSCHLSHYFKGEEPTPFHGKMGRLPMMSVPMVMANSSSSWVSILLGTKGSNFTICSACSSGTIALIEAYKRIRSGIDSMVICGGMESLKESTGVIMRSFDILGTLTSAEDGIPTPFSQERSGFLFSDGGACTLILEEKKSAQKRGATIYAEIDNVASNSDAHNIFQMEQSGSQIETLLKGLIGETKIDYINTHGTGTELNDRVESEIIQRVFGDEKDQPLINSTKGLLGHTISASGAFEAAVVCNAVKTGRVHGNKIKTPIENINLVDKSVRKEINYAISTSYGFGGHNGAIRFKRAD